MAVDENDKIIEFVEKPANPPTIPGDETRSLASMGIYVFDAEYLYQLLEDDDRDEHSTHDFGKDIIPRITAAGEAYAHPFPRSCVQSDNNAEPYWRDVGTLEAYWKANLDLASVVPELDVYDRNWPIRTYVESLPSAKFVQGPFRQSWHDHEFSGLRRLYYFWLGGGAVGSIFQSSD